MSTLVLVTVSAHSGGERKLVRSAALLCEVPAEAPSEPAHAVQIALHTATEHLDHLWKLQETATGLIVRHLVVPSRPPWAQFRDADVHCPNGVQIWMK